MINLGSLPVGDLEPRTPELYEVWRVVRALALELREAAGTLKRTEAVVRGLAADQRGAVEVVRRVATERSGYRDRGHDYAVSALLAELFTVSPDLHRLRDLGRQVQRFSRNGHE